MPEPPSLSLVLPAFNEGHRIERALREIVGYFRQRRRSVEIIVVADGCQDDTETVARRVAEEWPEVRCLAYQPNRGKGHAVRVGIKASVAPRVLFADADGSTPIEEMAKLEAVLKSDKDVAVASRQVAGARLDPPQPWSRRFLGRLFSLFTQTALQLPIRDTQCGFKLFPGPLAREIAGMATLDRWAMDLEWLILAKRLGATIHEVGVTWSDQPGSHVRPIRDGLRMARDTMRVRRLWLRGPKREGDSRR